MYNPREDSYFLSEILKKELKNEKRKFLDMGCGSGIQSLTALKFLDKKNITAVDIDKESIKETKKLGIKVINSNLFSKLKNKKYDIIAFNPPYLKEDKYDKNKDTTGGKFGDETILDFLLQAKNHLNKNGEIFLLLSSLTPKKRINKIIKQDYKIKNIFKKELFMEKLFVYELANKHIS